MISTKRAPLSASGRRARDRALGIGGFALLGALTLAVVFVIRAGIPVTFCVVRAMTGYACPGCGGTRALVALLSLDIARAMRMNAFLTPLLPVIAYIVIAELVRLVAGRAVLPQIPLHPVAIVLIAAAFLAFGVLRNFPAFSFLLPHA